MDNVMFGHVLHGFRQRKYGKEATLVAETFGIKHNSVSRRFMQATESSLARLLERFLSCEEIVAVFIDRKRLGEHGVIIALWVRIDGSKLVLGFIESSRQKYQVCGDFIRNLVERGL